MPKNETNCPCLSTPSGVYFIMQTARIELRMKERDKENQPIDGSASTMEFGRGEDVADYFARTALRGLTGQKRFIRELELFGGVE